MNTKRLIKSGVLAVLFLTLAVSLAFAQAPPSTAFTYQGQLKSEGQPYTGMCDFQFRLYYLPTGDTPVGDPIFLTEVPLSDGYFTVQLDFGAGAFTGEERWLEISVRCPAGTGDYTQLQPRQVVTPAPYAIYSSNNWSLTGNAGTTPGTNYLGTSDNQALEVKVNSQRVFRFEPNTTSPNLIGGYSGNSITSGVYGATLSGGGAVGYLNRVTDAYGSIGGGAVNLAGNDDADIENAGLATVSGGAYNTASGAGSAISGGYENTASGGLSAIGGGYSNTASADYATVSGGGPSNTSDPSNTKNKATDNYCTIGGGGGNQAGNADTDLNNAVYATVAGGRSNTASGYFSTIGGGHDNIASGQGSTVPGGYDNTAIGMLSVIGGGIGNTAIGMLSAIGGGDTNIASGNYSAIDGGQKNAASGQYSTVPGGIGNIASGLYSFAAGNQALATTDGSFVWADSQDASYTDHGINTFNVRAQNGVFVDASTTSQGLKVTNNISGSNPGEGTAVLGFASNNNGYGVAGWNDGYGVGLGAWSLNGNLIEAYAGNFMGDSYLLFYVDHFGNVRYAGTSGPMVAIFSPTGGAPSYVSLYGLSAAEAWYEDLGSASLVSGKVEVTIDPLFAQTVNLSEDYQVQVTATCNEPVLLYVSEKTTTYFTVQGVRLDGKPSNCAFDYRISAKAVGYETVRLESVDIPEPVISQREE